jgi:hypothetical protein
MIAISKGLGKGKQDAQAQMDSHLSMQECKSLM